MNEVLRTAAEAWATDALQTIEVEEFAQVDLDGLIQVDTPEVALDLGIETFSIVREVVRGHGTSAGVVLVLPLPASVDLATTPVAVEDWSASVDLRFSMPGIYILNPAVLFEWGEIEEYRTPTDYAEERILGARVYFRVFRSQSDARRGWEYTRAIYIVDGSNGTVAR